MADDVTAGELDRRLEAHERRTDRIHGEIDSRITNLAKDTVPLLVYQQGELDRDRAVQALTDRVAKLEERPTLSFGRWIGIIGVAVAFLALAVQAYGTWKGAK